MNWIEEVEGRASLNDGKGDLARALRIIKRLREALKMSEVALGDWINSHAPEFCDEARVAEAAKRLGERGTLAYVGEVCGEVVAALEYEGEG